MKNRIIALSSRRSAERQAKSAVSYIRPSVHHAPKINVPTALVYAPVQLKMRCLSPAGVMLIREEASRRNAE